MAFFQGRPPSQSRPVRRAHSLGTGISVDTGGNAYVAGIAGAGFPLMNPLQNTGSNTSAIIAKLNASGSALLYSTYFGF